MRGQQVLLPDSEDLWDELYQLEVSIAFAMNAPTKAERCIGVVP